MNILHTIPETYADGIGIRYSIYTAGCEHHCKGCHNPNTWNPLNGTPYEECLDNIIEEISKNDMLTGITVSGGDPFMFPKDLYDMLFAIKSKLPHITVWVYTGYTIEELYKLSLEGDSFILLALGLIDTLVDGPFVESLKIEGEFKGSSNQRIINNPLLYLLEQKENDTNE